MNTSYEDYIKKLIDDGYIGDDGRPLKCHRCKSNDLESVNISYEGAYIVEYAMMCKNCKETVGLWTYGNWQF